MAKEIGLSVIIPVSERYDDVVELYQDYKKHIESCSDSFEFMYVLDGEFPEVQASLEQLSKSGEPVRVIKLSKWFGEATALNAGLEKAEGEKVLTLPAYYQVEPSEIPKLLNDLDKTDMVIGWRSPRRDSGFNVLQTRLFHAIFNFMTNDNFHDLGCGVRAFWRRVANEVPIYGDQHRFFPVLASRRGFRVREVKLAQSGKEKTIRLYHPGVYLRRLLDILTVFFLAKFTKKPLRFFGLVGSGTFAVGGVVLVYLVIDRMFYDVAMADRPLLLLASLLIVLGVQIFAIGLLGELIIFTHAKSIKEYTIETIV